MKRLEVYKCLECGVLFDGATRSDRPLYCSKEMTKITPQMTELTFEKHVSYLKTSGSGLGGIRRQGVDASD